MKSLKFTLECRDGDLGEDVEYPQDLSFEALKVSLDEKR